MTIQLLVIGRHEEILATLLRLINANENWKGMGTLNDEDAKAIFDKHPIDLVLLSSGIDQGCEENLCGYFRSKQPDIPIIQHYGGGSGLLANEIRQALEQRQQPAQ